MDCASDVTVHNTNTSCIAGRLEGHAGSLLTGIIEETCGISSTQAMNEGHRNGPNAAAISCIGRYVSLPVLINISDTCFTKDAV